MWSQRQRLKGHSQKPTTPEPPEAGRGQEGFFPKASPADTLISNFRPPEPRVNFCVSHTVCCHLLQQSQEVNTGTMRRVKPLGYKLVRGPSCRCCHPYSAPSPSPAPTTLNKRPTDGPMEVWPTSRKLLHQGPRGGREASFFLPQNHTKPRPVG